MNEEINGIIFKCKNSENLVKCKQYFFCRNFDVFPHLFLAWSGEESFGHPTPLPRVAAFLEPWFHVALGLPLWVSVAPPPQSDPRHLEGAPPFSFTGPRVRTRGGGLLFVGKSRLLALDHWIIARCSCLAAGWPSPSPRGPSWGCSSCCGRMPGPSGVPPFLISYGDNT